MFDHYDWFLDYVKKLEQVTPQDVQRIARAYLSSKNRVVGFYRPTGEKENA